MGMSLIVKKITQLVIGLIFLFGINIILFGHWMWEVVLQVGLF